MITRSRRLLCAGLVFSAVGCSPAVPLAPPPLANPIAMQVAPGPGFSLQAAETVYLVMNAVDTRNRLVLPQLGDVVAAELRAATAAPVILLIQNGLDCPPPDDWAQTCRVCEV
ncbi:MAG TPA: hypothetical protein VM510_09480, partial [Caulifigura sp.]|nr:hypothetical protein [Caulifigura sp.]